MRKLKSAFLQGLFHTRLKAINARKEIYNKADPETIRDYQLSLFNNVWNRLSSYDPFYVWWRRYNDLPDHINSLRELRDFPLLTKEIINKKMPLILEERSMNHWTFTGGTSGIVTKFPCSRLDQHTAYCNAYIGRSFWNMKPFDETLMFWGNTHKFGKGLNSIIKSKSRSLKDSLLNIERISCYDLSSDTAERFVHKIITTTAENLITYSSNLRIISRYVLDSRDRSRLPLESKLKNIIVTSEPFTSEDFIEAKEVFGCNIINEYGMAETGAIAYSVQEYNKIQTLWHSFILTNQKNDLLSVTTLGDKAFPLINYDTQDHADIAEHIDNSVLSLKTIQGKKRPLLTITHQNGQPLQLSSILLDHILKHLDGVLCSSYKQLANSKIVIRLDTLNTATGLEQHVKQALVLGLRTQGLSVSADSMIIERGKLERTIAGKIVL